MDTDSEATVYSCSLSVLNLAAVISESIAAAAMRQLHVTRGDVNNVRVFVGVVAAVTLIISPVACFFPSRDRPNRPKGCADDEERIQLVQTRVRERVKNPFCVGSSDSESDQDDDPREHKSKDPPHPMQPV